MKKVFIFLCLLLVMALTVAFTYEGELDPDEFDSWKVVKLQPTSQGFVWMFAKNPDQASAIDIVAMAVGLNSTLFGYRYFKYGEPYSYVFDSEQNKYVRMELSEERRRRCMECHRGQLVTGTAI